MTTAAFEGQVALVTGAGGGIGFATAKAFAKAGTSVIVSDRAEETIGKAAEDLSAAGHNAIGVTCDVTDTDQVAAMIERDVSTYGRLDAARQQCRCEFRQCPRFWKPATANSNA